MTSTPPDTELDLSGFLAAHRAMRSEYGRLAAVAANPRDKAHAALIDDQIEVHTDLLHQHHTGEDERAWPRLRERAPGAAADLDLLEAQHAQRRSARRPSARCPRNNARSRSARPRLTPHPRTLRT